MNREILEAHLELHRAMMREVTARVSSQSFNSLTLDRVFIDEDGDLIAEYSAYSGCGNYDRETRLINPSDLFNEEDKDLE